MRKKNQTSEFIKDCIADSLLELMKNENFEAITIEEIIKKAGVGRTTFYRHFEQKSDILVYKFIRIYEEAKKKSPETCTYGALTPSSLSLFFEFIYEVRDILNLVFTAKQDATVYTAFKEIYFQEKDAREHTYEASFIGSGLFGVLSEWVENGFTDSPESMAEKVMDILHKFAR